MANEPERPIEKLLHAAAQKRRDEAGAPLELHPVNRRLLQDEVARVFPPSPPPRSSFVSVLLQMWPRFAGGLAILAVLAMAVWLIVPLPGNRKSDALLAKNLPEPQSSPARVLTPAAPSPPVVAPPADKLQLKNEPAVAALEGEKKADRSASARNEMADEQLKGLAASAAPAKQKDADLLASKAPSQRDDAVRSSRRQIGGSSGSVPPASAPAGSARAERSYAFSDTPAPRPSAAPAPSTAPAFDNQPAETPMLAPSDTKRFGGTPSSQSAGVRYKADQAAESANRLQPSISSADAISTVPTDVYKEAKRPAVAQSFVRVGGDARDSLALADKSVATGPVLTTFKLEQDGKELRVIDSDGSVYKGSLLAARARRSVALKAESAAAARAAKPADRASEEKLSKALGQETLPEQSYSFRVAGTNLSLNQKVVFTGTLLAVTNQDRSRLTFTNAVNGGALGGSVSEPARQSSMPLLRARISGKVVVGSGAPVDVNALPKSP